MRRVLLIAAVAAMAIAGIAGAGTASAQRVSKFTVDAVTRHGHRVGSSFIFGGQLFAVDSDDVVGSFKAKATPRGGHRTRIRANAFFRGEGLIKAKGIIGPGDNRIVIIGGTDDFNGASGKILIHNEGRNRAELTFVVVQ